MNPWTKAAFFFTAVWAIVMVCNFVLAITGRITMIEFLYGYLGILLGIQFTAIPCGHMGHRAMARAEVKGGAE